VNERSDLHSLADARRFASRAHDLTGGMTLDMPKELDHYEHAARSYLILLGAAFSCVGQDVRSRHPDLP
jgi:uncharacterized protein with HEPN domain